MPRYTDKQKLAYYKKLAQEERSKNTYGQGRYRVKRKRNYAKGRGAYEIPRDFFSASKAGGALGGASGAAIGNMLAPGIGGEIGASLGSLGGSYMGRLFKKITGWGDYTVKENSLIYEDTIVPSFGEDSIRVRKREFIADINSVIKAFTLQSFPIQPGLDETFPWLASVARNYEQYRINGMIFQFVSTSSDAIADTTNLGLGQVILATDYNAADDDFQDAPQMLNYMFSNSGKPSENIMHAIECAPTDTAQKLYYVRSGAVPGGQDPRLYDMGTFQIAVNNMPATYSGMGQLWVSYDITFCKSQQNNLLGFGINSDLFQLSVGITNALPFGTDEFEWQGVAGSSIGCTLDSDSIFFPEGLISGYYMISARWVGTSGAITNPTWTGINCLPVQCWQGNSNVERSPVNGSTATSASARFVVKLGTTDSNTQVSIGCAAAIFPTALSTCNLSITQVNGEIYNDFAVGSSPWSA